MRAEDALQQAKAYVKKTAQGLGAVQGQPGRNGQDGQPGRDGADGVSPVAEVRRNDTDDGVVISITDKDGTKEAEVKDGIVGQPGTDGQPGEKGEPGEGVPAGGTTGQILVKKSEADFDTEWQTPQSGGGTIVTDATPTQGSQNPIQSGGVFDALEAKQDTLTGTQGQLVGFDAQGAAVPVEAPETGVVTFNGRTGAVTPEAGDYTADMVGAEPAGSANTALTDAKAYTDTKHTEALNHADTKLTEANNYTDEKLVEAKEYADGKLTEANQYTDTKVADLVGTAPQTLDTLQELAEALEQNDNVVDALNEAIGKKANQADLEVHTQDLDIHVTADEKLAWNEVKDEAVRYDDSRNVHFEKLVVLDTNQKLLGKTPDGDNHVLAGTLAWNVGTPDEYVQNEFGSSHVHMNLNSKDRPTIELPGGVKHEIAYKDDVPAGGNGYQLVEAKKAEYDLIPEDERKDIAYFIPDDSIAGVGGSGLPTGGTTGQVLAKKSEADGDAEWIDPQQGGVTVPVTGFVTMGVEDDGILYVYHAEVAPGDPNPYATMFELEEDTGNLYYITEVA